MATARENAFSHLLAPGMRKIFFEKYGQRPDEYSQVFNVDSSQRAYEEDSEVTGLGRMPEKPEGRPTTYDSPFQANVRQRYTHVSYGLGFRVTHELYEDDLYRIIRRMPTALARSAHQTIEVVAWNVFNRAFNSSFTGIDGVELCSTAHTNIARTTGSGPYANKPTTDVDLSVTSLQAAVENLENTTDDRDINVMIKPRMLVIAPENKWMARELLNSEKKPHTADNEINALVDEELKYLISHFMSDNDAWFLNGGKDDHYLNFFWRERLRMDNDDDFDTGDAKFKGFMRFSAGFSGWRGVYGSSGA
jgi:hypothetical protein|tara:strand:- start:12006 stop:12923 length:918 start_codon:yes stop_codon:yes gene_type:complete